MKDIILKFRPPRIALTMMIVTGILYLLLPGHRLSLWYSPFFGMVSLMTGFGVMMWGWAEFRRLDNPVCHSAIPVRLVRTGPYRLFRNPMYLGMLLMMLGPFFWLGAPFLLLAPVVFFVLINFIFIPYEECRIKSLFKEEYIGYRAGVRRLL